MKITFCLTQHSRAPIGGHKVVYEYANGLCARGHEVHVVHPAILRTDTPLLQRAVRLGRYVQRGLTGDWKPGRWFDLNPGVRMHWVTDLRASHIPDSDIVVATGWQTADWVVRYPASKGRPYYLIQHYETWAGPKDRVEATWRFPLRKIVIAKWLSEYAEARGESSISIPNGLDFQALGVDIAPEDRNPASVMALCHRAGWKGSADAIAALEKVKREIPELQVTLFGLWPRPKLPAWIRYHRQPSPGTLRRLYNETAIFVTPSYAEGWALPPAEAMACGAALIATDIGGHHDYAHEGETALLFQPGDTNALAKAVTDLIRDPKRRIELACRGHAFVQRFTWDTSVGALERALATP